MSLGRLLLLLASSAAALRIAPARPVEHAARHAAPALSIAVFGASGATGSEAVLQALERGEDVTCLVRDRSKLMAPRTAAGFSQVRCRVRAPPPTPHRTRRLELKSASRFFFASREKASRASRPSRLSLAFSRVSRLSAPQGAPFASDKLAVTQGSVTNKADVDAVFAAQKVSGVVIALGGKTSDVGPTMLQDGTANVIAAMKANDVKRISVVTTIGAGDSMEQAPWAFRLLMMTVMSSIMADKNKQEELFLNGVSARKRPPRASARTALTIPFVRVRSRAPISSTASCVRAV